MSASNRLFTQAKRILPGGVNSPVRAFSAVGGTPPFIRRARGARVVDEDGRSYVDFVMSWGPMIHGHAPAGLRRALCDAVDRGTSFGAPTALEVELGRAVRRLMPSIERIRFVNSGTEATMSALRLGRAVTGRDRVIKFGGCYHGHGDAFLVQAGSGATTLGVPTSPGVPRAVAADTLVARYNDLDSVEQLFKKHRHRIAALIVEPIAGNMGVVPPARGFLEGLRALTSQHDALLIFDEVQTGVGRTPEASIKMLDGTGMVYSQTSLGNGPVDAVCNAISGIVGFKPTLDDFSVRSITEGLDAQGDVTIRLEYEGRLYTGRGADTDILVASAKAYTNAINRLISMEQIGRPHVTGM